MRDIEAKFDEIISDVAASVAVDKASTECILEWLGLRAALVHRAILYEANSKICVDGPLRSLEEVSANNIRIATGEIAPPLDFSRNKQG